MFNNRIILFIALFLTLITPISSQAFQTDNQAKITLPALLEKLPAQDGTEAELIFSALLNTGNSGIEQICRQLNAPQSEKVTQAKFALNGLAKFVSRGDREAGRIRFVQAVLAALQQNSNTGTQSFLIRQVQIAGKDEAVVPLSRYLNDEKLCEPATQALLAIATGAAKEVLLAALEQVNQANQITIAKALGELRCKKAVPKIKELSQSKNENIRAVSLFALANIGADGSESVLRQAVQTASQKQVNELSSCLLLFAQRRAEAGDKQTGGKIYRDVLQTGPDAARSSALTSQIELTGAAALPDLLTALDSPVKSLQNTALMLAARFPGQTATEKFALKMEQAPPQLKNKLLLMLGQRGDKTAVPAVKTAMMSGNVAVKIAAVQALTKLNGPKSVSDFLHLLSTTENGEVITAVKNALLQFPVDEIAGTVVKSLQGATDPAKIALLDILSQRKAQVKTKVLFKLAKSSNLSVQRAAIRTLSVAAGDRDWKNLLKLLFTAEDGSVREATQNALIAILKKSSRPETRIADLRKRYRKADQTKKQVLLRILAMTGDEKALELIAQEAYGADPDIQQAAIRALSASKKESAFAPLFNAAQQAQDADQRILAVQGCLQILESAGMYPAIKIQRYKKLMPVAERPEEKKAILAALSNIQTPATLQYAARFLQDDVLKSAAAVAAAKIAATEKKQQDALSGYQIVSAMIGAQDENLQAIIDNQFPGNSGLNQPPRGFTALFNGKDLTGWKGLVANPVKRAQMSEEELAKTRAEADKLMRQHWRLENGILMFDGKGHSLCTAKDYTNFEMFVDWKIGKHGDSGIYLRGSPQVQIWDTAQWPEGSGGLYNNKKGQSKPLVCADNPIGEWNRFHIIMIDDRVTVYLNDVLVVDNVVMENYWERNKPIYPTGQIELQSHNSQLYFRNIFIRELPETKKLFSGPLFNGEDLSGWQQIGGKKGSWRVEKGILFTTGKGGGWLSTEKEFANFILELEFRVPPGGNSGVFLRTPRQGNPAYVGMEIQVLDDYAAQYANLHKWQYTGSVYGVQAPSARVTKHAGRWQTMKIICKDPHVQVIVNGTQTIDTNLIDHLDLEASHPGLKRRKGYIGLQNHSLRVEFRNIHIKELE